MEEGDAGDGVSVGNGDPPAVAIGSSLVSSICGAEGDDAGVGAVVGARGMMLHPTASAVSATVMIVAIAAIISRYYIRRGDAPLVQGCCVVPVPVRMLRHDMCRAFRTNQTANHDRRSIYERNRNLG